jgi:hypothetical protein
MSLIVVAVLISGALANQTVEHRQHCDERQAVANRRQINRFWQDYQINEEQNICQREADEGTRAPKKKLAARDAISPQQQHCAGHTRQRAQEINEFGYH